eukprot:12248609-Alexandrium_andersonii.AAC.1
MIVAPSRWKHPKTGEWCASHLNGRPDAAGALVVRGVPLATTQQGRACRALLGAPCRSEGNAP